MGVLEPVAVMVTLAAVYLTTRQVIWCWPLGMVSVTLYAAVFFEARLYADMGLQGLYFSLSVYGWWAWLHGGSGRATLAVTRTPLRKGIALVAIATLAGLALGRGLAHYTDASLPFLDSLLTSFSIAAQWMQTRKLLESWIVWLAVDVCYAGMFLYKSLYLTAGLYVVFLALAVMGLAAWRRSMPADPRPALEAAL